MCIGLRGKSQEGFMYIIAYKILSRILLQLLLLRWSALVLSAPLLPSLPTTAALGA